MKYIDKLKEYLMPLFNGSTSLDALELKKILCVYPFSEAIAREELFGLLLDRVMPALDRVDTEVLFAYPDLPTLSFYVAIFYWHVHSNSQYQDYGRPEPNYALPKWFLKLTLFGDCEVFRNVKNFVYSHGYLFLKTQI